MSDQAFVAPRDGWYEVTYGATVAGGFVFERAVYLGHPLRDPAAKVIQGRDLLRGDNALRMNSGPALHTDTEGYGAQQNSSQMKDVPSHEATGSADRASIRIV